MTFARIQEELGNGSLSQDARTALGCAAGGNKEGKNYWFKTVGEMEEIGRDIIWPNLDGSDKEFKDVVVALRRWCIGG